MSNRAVYIIGLVTLAITTSASSIWLLSGGHEEFAKDLFSTGSLGTFLWAFFKDTGYSDDE